MRVLTKKPLFVSISLALGCGIFLAFYLRSREDNKEKFNGTPEQVVGVENQKENLQTKSQKVILDLENIEVADRVVTRNIESANSLRASFRKILENRDPHQEPVKFIQGNEKLISLPGLLAVPKKDAGGESVEEEIAQLFGFSVIREENQKDTMSAYPIVRDNRTGALAIVSGNLKIKHDPSFDPKGLEKVYALKLIQSFPPIRLTIFESEETGLEKINEKAQAIRQLNGVESVELDLINGFRRPR